MTVSDVLGLAMELNAPDYHVFIHYSGHIGSMDLRVYHGGWTDTADISSRYDWCVDTYLAYDWLEADHEKYRGSLGVAEKGDSDE